MIPQQIEFGMFKLAYQATDISIAISVRRCCDDGQVVVFVRTDRTARYVHCVFWVCKRNESIT